MYVMTISRYITMKEIEAIVKFPERSATIGMDSTGKNIKYITTRIRCMY